MKIKRLLCLALVPMIVLMSSCSGGKENQAVTQSTEAEIDYSGTILKVNDRTAGTDFSTGVGQLNYQSLFMDTDIKFRSTNYSMDETRLKLLAGDSDIDIYIISASEIPSFIENGFYTPFESEVIDEYISQCHEMLQEYSYIDGKAAFVPVLLSIPAILIPKSAIEETGVKYSDIEYLDGYLEFARSYEGERIAYTGSTLLFSFLQEQYELYYCDIENKDVDFETPLYMHIYEEIWGGWQDPRGGIGATIGFEHHITGDYSNNSEKALCTYGTYLDSEIFTDKRLNTDPNVYMTSGSTDFFEKWRAFPIPKISKEVTSNSASAAFAFINPFSENKDAALYVLETIASDFFRYSGYYTKFSMQFEDKSAYPEYFYPESEIFNDFFSMTKSIAFSDFAFTTKRTDIDDYQAGKLTLEEAVAEYQRQVDIWLNE